MSGGIDETVTVILAGGQARRLGHVDKAAVVLDGKTMLERVCGRVHRQTPDMVINANGDLSRFAGYDLPTVPDPVAGHPGPLAGILAGMMWATENHADAKWLMSVPVDTPFLPSDLGERLHQAQASEGTPFSCARSNGRNHPVVGLWSLTMMEALRTALIDEGIRKVDRWTGEYGCAVADFGDGDHDPFFNINQPEDITMAESILGAQT